MTLRHKRKDTAGYVWTGTDLVQGQLGINERDGTVHLRKSVGGGSDYITLQESRGPFQDFDGPISAATGTTTIPYDDTAPLITEGTEIWSQAITLQTTDHHAQINFAMVLEASNASKDIIIAIFRDSTCIGAVPVDPASNNSPVPFIWRIVDSPASIAAITYSVRIGVTGGTWRVNTDSTGNLGGTIEDGSFYSIQEFLDG